MAFMIDSLGLLSSMHTDFWANGMARKCITTTTTPTFPDPTGKPERHASPALPLQLWVKPQQVHHTLQHRSPSLVLVPTITIWDVCCAPHLQVLGANTSGIQDV